MKCELKVSADMDRLSILYCRLKANLSGCVYRLFGQTVRQSFYDFDVGNASVCAKFEGARIPNRWAKHYISDCGIEARLDGRSQRYAVIALNLAAPFEATTAQENFESHNIRWNPYRPPFTANRLLQPSTSHPPELPDRSTIETVPPPARPASPGRPASGSLPASRRRAARSLLACRSSRKPVSRLRAIRL